MIGLTAGNIVAATAGASGVVLVGEIIVFGVLGDCMRLTGPATDGEALEDIVICGAGTTTVCGFAELAAGARGSKLWTRVF